MTVAHTIVSFRDMDSTVRSTTDGLYGLTKYPAKFIPQVVNFAMDRAQLMRDANTNGLDSWCVTDPFAGTGTVAISAHLRHAQSELWDINPIMGHYQMAHKIVLASHTPPLYIALAIEKRLATVRLSRTSLPQPTDSLDYLSSWYHPAVFRIITYLWSVYFDCNAEERALLLMPLLRLANKWSYNDLQRQKLCRSTRKHSQIALWIEKLDWEQRLLRELSSYVTDAASRYTTHKTAASWVFNPITRIVSPNPQEQLEDGTGDVVITSPPYLQAQEYIRGSKLSLLWLGHSLDEIRARMRLEIPYGNPRHDQNVASPMFNHIHGFYERTEDSKALRVLESYFTNTLAVLESATANAKELYLFVGSAGLHGTSIPLDVIFAEHFVNGLGWKHSTTLSDTIVAKTLFKSAINPATGRSDQRMSTEQLVVLVR